MTSQNNEQVLANETPFITVLEAESQLRELSRLAPVGGKLFGREQTYCSSWAIFTPESRAQKAWRIGLSIEIPRFANGLFGLLANWGVPLSTRKIEFVLAGEADSMQVGPSEGPYRRAHRYTVLSGTPDRKLKASIEMAHARPFSNPGLAMLYEDRYDTTVFQQALAVIRAEITGERR